MPWTLLFRNMIGHPVRSTLTVLSVAVALALLCVLDATARGYTAAVDLAAQNRLVVMSQVSLFVPLPLSYQSKIQQVEGVKTTTKFQWFGGEFGDRGGFFAQFGIDAESFESMYPEIELVEGSYEEFRSERTGCVIGQGLADQFGWAIGDSIPLITPLFPRGKSGEEAWTFVVRGIYKALRPNFDEQTMFFHFDYLRESLEGGAALGPPGVGTYAIEIDSGVRAETVMAAVDGLFENGPQRVRTTPEAEFNRQFLSMMGDIPLLLRSIGGAVLFAIFFAVLNTMLMAGRERTRDLGIMKALGFKNAYIGAMLVIESMLLILIGSVLGIALAHLLAGIMKPFVSGWAPGFAIDGAVLLNGLAMAAGLGLISGLAPGLRAARLLPVRALREDA
jgi:putative ABC transport system permease protein